MEFILRVILSISCITLSLARYSPIAPVDVENLCPNCETQYCPNSPSDCVFGLIRDDCGCCPHGVCRLRENEKCSNNKKPTDMNKYGRCGDNMACILRDDLRPEDEPESLCVCQDKRIACGADNVTYHSICHMREFQILFKHWGPCNSPPEIISGPEDAVSFENKRLALDCEVKGYPVPNVFWEFQGLDGVFKSLPGDDATIGVQNRGGPESYMVTSWVQIEMLRPSDAGVYTCVAKNNFGIIRSSATVHLDQPDGFNDFGDAIQK